MLMVNQNQGHMNEEWQWIQHTLDGNTTAFEALYKRHAQKLFSLCLHFCSTKEDAEEELQEIFIKLLKGLKTFRREALFSTWAYRIAVNHLCRSKKKKIIPFEKFEVETIPSRSPNIHLNIVLTDVIRQLPEKMKQVFVLHDRLGFTHDEIGTILGCKTVTSRSILCRARMGLREKLSRVRGGNK